MKIYNSLTKKKERFKPLKDNLVRMYVCGPTVYDNSHLGHGVTYVRFDFIRRFLEFLGYKVKFVMNITDIHDDILKRAKELNLHPQKLAEIYTKNFLEDMERIKFKKPNKLTKVTEHLKEIIELIKKLVKRGYAYETEDGVYFDVSKFKNYGKLSGVKVEKEITGTRVKTDKYEKETAVDFALWKKEKDEWLFDSLWGKGRPGWHIECSAMSIKYLGIPFDIHAGAIDLIFPHHENEIAQSEAAYEKKFVNFFVHGGLLTINGQKMSKSLGNFIFLKDYLKENSPRFFRFFVLIHHYRSPIDFNEKNINEAKNLFFNLNERIAKLKELKHLGKKKYSFKKVFQKIIKALKDDFNSSLAFHLLYQELNKIDEMINNNELNQKSVKEIMQYLKELDSFFLYLFPWQKIDKKTKDLIKEREKLRKERKFEIADKIRNELQKQNIYLEDIKEKNINY